MIDDMLRDLLDYPGLTYKNHMHCLFLLRGFHPYQLLRNQLGRFQQIHPKSAAYNGRVKHQSHCFERQPS